MWPQSQEHVICNTDRLVREKAASKKMGDCDASDKRALSRCSSCESVDRLRCYPAEAPRDCWYACADCVALIGNEEWDDLIERIVAAYAALQPIPEDEQVVFRQELGNHLKAFDTFYLRVV